MKDLIKGAGLLIGGAALGVLGTKAYESQEKAIKKKVKDILPKKVKAPTQSKKTETKKEK